MNRTCAAVFLVLLLLLFSLCGCFLLQNSCAVLDQSLGRILPLCQAGRSTQVLAECQQLEEWFHTRRALLSLWIPQDMLAELEQTLACLAAYTDPDHFEDLACETKRARSQVRALKSLFFGVL